MTKKPLRSKMNFSYSDIGWTVVVLLVIIVSFLTQQQQFTRQRMGAGLQAIDIGPRSQLSVGVVAAVPFYGITSSFAQPINQSGDFLAD